MSAQIIPFPKHASVREGMFLGGTVAITLSPVSPRISASGLHLVATPRTGSQGEGSQQTALRIVENVCAEHALQHPASTRSEEFWATVPVPATRAETPLSVMRRLAHMLLFVGELA